MKRLAIAVALAAAALIAPVGAAHAEGVYGNLGYTQFDSDAGDAGGVTGRLGWRFAPNFAVEGEATVGASDDLDNELGVFGVGILPVSPDFDVFARVGYHQTEYDGGFEDDGVAAGVGVQWNANDNFGVRGEYTRYDGDAETDAFGVSAVWMW